MPCTVCDIALQRCTTSCGPTGRAYSSCCCCCCCSCLPGMGGVPGNRPPGQLGSRDGYGEDVALDRGDLPCCRPACTLPSCFGSRRGPVVYCALLAEGDVAAGCCCCAEAADVACVSCRLLACCDLGLLGRSWLVWLTGSLLLAAGFCCCCCCCGRCSCCCRWRVARSSREYLSALSSFNCQLTSFMNISLQAFESSRALEHEGNMTKQQL